jgi:adenylate cyclase
VQAGNYAWLLVEATGAKVALSAAQSWTIGRSDACRVVLESRSVSRLHALVQRLENGKHCLIDLGSRNGSLVNGQRVTVPATLHDGDRITLADQALIFRGATGAPELRTAATEAPTSALFTHTPATVLVVDIREFTPLARKVEQGLLSQTIGTWFLRVGTIAQQRGSWGQQYVGDAVMSVWTHPPEGSRRADLLRVLHALRDIVRATAELHRVFPLPHPIRIGAGINTGPAIVGSTDFTALGDTVNLAFRLESATKEMSLDIAIGQASFEALAPGFEEALWFERRQLDLKGYDRPVPAWVGAFERLDGFLTACEKIAVPGP